VWIPVSTCSSFLEQSRILSGIVPYIVSVRANTWLADFRSQRDFANLISRFSAASLRTFFRELPPVSLSSTRNRWRPFVKLSPSPIAESQACGSVAYSAFARFKIGMSASASFQRLRNA
jgi:hypothetical protein